MTLNVEPKEVFHWFYEINQIPRCSGDEKRVSDFLVNFAKERNLEVLQDSAYNVIIKKPASEGYENSVPVIIQGHMDMVCVKTDDSNHNFDTDPIEMIVEDDLVRANNTTLGGDDGIAVAYGLAVLDGNYKHPALEVLITTSEETNMGGASAIKEGMLNGKRLLNIDSEEEGIFLVSCAGGTNIESSFDLEYEDFSGSALEISVSGLVGGHSGQEIIKQRANANKVLFRLIDAARKSCDLRLVKAVGGSKHNAIPVTAKATVLVSDENKAKDEILKLANLIKREYSVEEAAMTIEVSKAEAKKAIKKEISDGIIDFFVIVPDGVMAMSKDIEGLVQTSLNNAVLLEENNVLTLDTSIRSSVESELDKVVNVMQLLANRVGAKTKEVNRYPGWEFEKESVLRDFSMKVYEELFNTPASYQAIHAGLECGLLKKVMPDCDMISFGPNMWDIHSPKERLSISSTQRMWKFLLKLLEDLK